jgi:DNA (cytosine-5)-methyltransferase 1
MSNNEANRLFNIYGEQFGTGFAGNVWDKEALSPALMTAQGGNREPMVLDDESKPLNEEADGTCRTIKSQYQQTSRANSKRQSTFGATGVQNGLRIRKLTPKECFRLMDFTDEQFERAEKVCSNSRLYMQAGNSIVVNVLYHIFKQMMEGEEE